MGEKIGRGGPDSNHRRELGEGGEIEGLNTDFLRGLLKGLILSINIIFISDFYFLY